jgi:hypothetical protein
MRDVSLSIARGAGLRTLAGAGLFILTGCGVIIDEPQQLSGAPVTSAVRSRWYDTAYALGFVREFCRTLGPERLYQVQEPQAHDRRKRA